MVSGLLGISTSDIFKRESTFWVNKNTNEYFECPLVDSLLEMRKSLILQALIKGFSLSSSVNSWNN